MRGLLLAAFLAGAASPSFANQQEFCAGFAYGYKSVQGQRSAQSERTSIPTCPTGLVVLDDSTDFEKGIRAGVAEAQRL